MADVLAFAVIVVLSAAGFIDDDGSALHVAPIARLDDVRIVVEGAPVRVVMQDGAIVTVVQRRRRDGAWEFFGGGGCGTGMERTKIAPGVYSTPLRGTLAGPGTYRVLVAFEKNGRRFEASRIFELAPLPSPGVKRVIEAVVKAERSAERSAAQECRVPWFDLYSVFARADADDLAALLDVDGISLHRRVELLGQAMSTHGDFHDRVYAALIDGRPDIELTAALAAARYGRNMEVTAATREILFGHLVGALERGDGGVETARALLYFNRPFGGSFWPYDATPLVLAKLDATRDPEMALALAAIIDDRDPRSAFDEDHGSSVDERRRPQDEKALAHADAALARLARLVHLTPQQRERIGARRSSLTSTNRAWVRDDDFDRDHLECVVPAEARAVIDAAKAAVSVRDLGALQTTTASAGNVFDDLDYLDELDELDELVRVSVDAPDDASSTP